VVQRLGQNVPEVVEEAGSAFGPDPSGPGVDAGPPEGLVCVDVADSGNEALGQELRLDPATAADQGPVEGRPGQGRVEGFWSQIPESGQQPVVAP
jgi:hypothetical protein|tara:strand:- start:131 stop:415 length:285 start_codon:yes stop_codon:yes gene_type:complete